MVSSIFLEEKDYLFIKHSQIASAGNGLFSTIDVFTDLGSLIQFRYEEQAINYFYVGIVFWGLSLLVNIRECFGKYKEVIKGWFWIPALLGQPKYLFIEQYFSKQENKN